MGPASQFGLDPVRCQLDKWRSVTASGEVFVQVEFVDNGAPAADGSVLSCCLPVFVLQGRVLVACESSRVGLLAFLT